MSNFDDMYKMIIFSLIVFVFMMIVVYYAGG
jgi:hypothetical protein